MSDYRGILCIGDPHLSSRAPGFRKDDYPRVMLEKLEWALDYACEHDLLPVLLGDLFHYPRDNANWLLVELIGLFGSDGVCAIAGNHDCTEDQLNEHDTFSILLAAGSVRLLDARPWRGTMNGRRVHVGGSTWNTPLPERIDRATIQDPELVFWITHHDISFPGYAMGVGQFGCADIAGVDLVVNGHLHARMDDVITGTTTWCNPGSLARVDRGDATRAHVPSVLRIDVSVSGWSKTRVPAPHEPFENVFHPQVEADLPAPAGESLFITGLAALQRFKTAGGEGLREFIERNMEQFPDPRVQHEIRALATEVLNG
jgi:predicted phosphodiesterase